MQITAEEAQDARRLSLWVDDSGCVVATSKSPASLFGADPERLVGCQLASLVDVFTDWCAAGAAAGRRVGPQRACGVQRLVTWC
jgi:hypothetical protein